MPAKTSQTHPLQIGEVRPPGGGVIGMTFCPGKKQRNGASGDWDRDLELDLKAVRAWGACAVVSLMEAKEFHQFAVPGLGEAVERLGMEWHHLPIIDGDIPGEPFARRWGYSGLRLRAHLAAGRHILLHCRGGLGRTGMIAASLLVERGVAPEQAIRSVRAARPGAIETTAQEAFVRATLPVDAAADDRASRVLGCLLGGAVGDGFGYAVEFDHLDDIRQRYGAAGLRAPVLHNGRLVVSDDTQMTLFTLEGLARAIGQDGAWSEHAAVTEVRRAYLDWLDTQGASHGVALAGTLATHSALRFQRAPGNTCLSALHAGGNGTISTPINDSKGCGGAMRTAPAGLLPGISPVQAFALGARIGALTHGHPDGWGPSGFVAAAVCRTLGGESLEPAIVGALADLRSATAGSDRVPSTAPYENALRLGRAAGDDAPSDIRQLGEGWTGEEAAAIGAYAALTGKDFADVVARAANHDGDSDSTASIAGQLWGAAHGLDGIPHGWVRRLDVFDEVLWLAADPVWANGGQAKAASAVVAQAIAPAGDRAKLSGFGELPDGWAELIVASGVDQSKPGIYEWRIEGVGTYIGKYTHIRRPLREYARNVARRLAGQWYRKNNINGFRRIHVELAQAVELKRRITLTILENVAPARLNQREHHLIRARGATLNGPYPFSGAAD